MHDTEWLIAIDAAAGRTGERTEAIIRVASRIEREWLAPTRSTIEQKVNESGSVTAREIDWYGELILCGAPAGDERRHDGGSAGCRVDGARSRQEHRPPAAADQIRRSWHRHQRLRLRRCRQRAPGPGHRHHGRRVVMGDQAAAGATCAGGADRPERSRDDGSTMRTTAASACQ